MHIWPLCFLFVFCSHSNCFVIPNSSKYFKAEYKSAGYGFNTLKLFLTDTIMKKRDILLYNHSASMQWPEGNANTHCLAQRHSRQSETEYDIKKKVKAIAVQVKKNSVGDSLVGWRYYNDEKKRFLIIMLLYGYTKSAWACLRLLETET